MKKENTDQASETNTGFEHLKAAFEIIAREQGIDRPNVRSLGVIISNLYRGEGKKFLMSVRQAMRSESYATRNATRVEKPRGERPTPARSPSTNQGQVSANNDARLNRLQRQAKRAGVQPVPTPVPDVADKSFVAPVTSHKTEPKAKEATEPKEANLSPLTDVEAKEVHSLSPKNIAKQFGAPRIKATLMKMGHLETEFEDRSATQLAVMLKDSLS